MGSVRFWMCVRFPAFKEGMGDIEGVEDFSGIKEDNILN